MSRGIRLWLSSRSRDRRAAPHLEKLRAEARVGHPTTPGIGRARARGNRCRNLCLLTPLVAPLVTLGLLALGCSSGHHEAEQQRSAVSSSSSLDDGGPATCPPIAGSLVLYAIPPPAPLDWSTPNHLLETAAASSAAGEALVTAGGAALSHEIGHVNLELDCGDTGFPLTGQTGGGSDIVSGADGAGHPPPRLPWFDERDDRLHRGQRGHRRGHRLPAGFGQPHADQVRGEPGHVPAAEDIISRPVHRLRRIQELRQPLSAAAISKGPAAPSSLAPESSMSAGSCADRSSRPSGLSRSSSAARSFANTFGANDYYPLRLEPRRARLERRRLGSGPRASNVPAPTLLADSPPGGTLMEGLDGRWRTRRSTSQARRSPAR